MAKKLTSRSFVFRLFGIIVLSLILRFTNYPARWGLAYDQAHDALVARYALEAGKIPLVGPFSSAGPFQTGGEWYWLIMAATAIHPRSVLTPWIVLTLSSVVFVYLLIRIGRELIDDRFGLIVGILAAVSTAGISQSLNLTNQSPLSFVSLLAIWSVVRYLRTRRLIYTFFLGFFPALAATIHLQGVALFILLPTTMIFIGFPTLRHIFMLSIGVAIPLIPLILYDLTHQFTNFMNMINYYLYGSRLVSYESLGRRWLTYLGVFWPAELAHIIGGVTPVAYVAITLTLVVFVNSAMRKKVSREFWILLISFLGMVSIVRYAKTPLFSSYITFLHPFVLILIGYGVYEAYKKVKLLGVILLIVMVGGSIIKDIGDIKSAENFTVRQVREWRDVLVKNYPNDSFAVYDLEYARRDKTLPLALFLDVENKIADDGRKVGLGIQSSKIEVKNPSLLGPPGGYQLFDLSSSSSAELKDFGWVFVNPSQIYKATEEWQN